jgi:hypothetical protein
MNKLQSIHVAMLNSYNLILGKVSIDDIVKSGIAVFAHVPDDPLEVNDIKFVIKYFESIEMFEQCAILLDYINENYNDDGSFKEEDCDCELPDIEEYTIKMKCSKCNKRLRK